MNEKILNKNFSKEQIKFIEENWLLQYGKNCLDKTTFKYYTTKKVNKVISLFYDLIKFNEINYLNYGRKIFCRETAEEIYYELNKQYILIPRIIKLK